MLTGKPTDIPAGGACAFQLPHDPSCASHARSLLAATMRDLGFPADSIADAKLAVSELATNAHAHASGRITTARPELWMWARTHPVPELVVSVFDTQRESWPVTRSADLLDEHGKGLAIVAALSTHTGTHLTRSRLTTATGKSVWFTLSLPTPWPGTHRAIAPAHAAHRLFETLRARGIPATLRSDEDGVSVLNIETLNVWVEPEAFTWRDDHRYSRQPLIDLHETAERIVSRHETTSPTPSPA